MSSRYSDIGDRLRVSGRFRDFDDELADPDGVTFSYYAPGDTPTVLVYGTDDEVVKDEVGVYHVDVDVDTAGTWHFRFEGAGEVQAAVENTAEVRPSNF